MDPSGWEESAAAWIEIVERDPNRTHLLDDVVIELLGDVGRCRILDVGCGEGRFCRMLRSRGAQVVGIDPTLPLLNHAAGVDPEGGYLVASGESLPLRSGSVDVALSYLTLIDIPDFRAAIAEMARVVRQGGRLVIANLNPFVTSQPWGWHRNAEGMRTHYPVDNYNAEIGHRVAWKGVSIINYHRPLSAYMDAFLGAGLQLRKYLEPIPTDEAIRSAPDMEDYRRVPLCHVMEWVKA